uniref:Uncharacterized protein n=1 Tax=Alexandrium monilatum TaxID=311494 RepID=A0A7S4SGL7_9DINO
MGAPCCKQGPAAEKHLKGYLAWREAAIVSHGCLAEAHKGSQDPLSEDVVQVASDLHERVKAFLASDAVLGKPGFTPEGVEELKPKDSDWRGFSRWMIDRVHGVNQLGGPRVKVVSWKTLRQLGRFPKFPTESGHILDAEVLLKEYARIQDDKGKVEGRVICFSFFSHRWERPSRVGAGAHPDSEDHKKAKALAKFGEFGSCPIFAEHHGFDYYFWVDYSSIDQVNSAPKEMGIAALSAYVASCIQMIMYNSETAEYEPRAWTRLERMMGYTYCACPLFKYLDDSYPYRPIDVDGIISQNPACFKKGEEAATPTGPTPASRTATTSPL